MAAQSKERLFSKKLKVTDINKRLAIPTKILSSLPDFNGGHAVKIQLVHGIKTWDIECTVRKQGYKKPVFSGGLWRDFVEGNKLKVGDSITMYKVKDDDGSSSHYRVELEMEQTGSRNQDRSHDLVDETEFGNKKANTLDTETKCFGGNMTDIGMGEDEPPLVSLYMAKKESEINFFGLSTEAMPYGYGTIHQLAAARESLCNTMTDPSLSLDLILGQPTPAEEMNLDLTLAPLNA